VGGNAVALGRPFGVQQEAAVHPGPTLHDRGPVHLRPPGQERPHHFLGRGQDAAHVHAGPHAEVVEGGGQHLGGRVARAGAERAQRAVHLAGAVLVGQHRVGHAEGEVLVAVEADLGLVADLGVHGLDPLLRVAEHQRARRVHAVDALRARVHHDPGLPGQLVR